MQHTYLLASGETPGQLLKEIEKNHAVKPDKKSQSQREFFDTFDWRLYRNGWGLSLDDHQFNLITLDNENILTSFPWKKRKHPRFIDEFSDSKLKNLIEPILSVRALMPLAKIVRKRQSCRILNEDKKTVLILHLDELNITGTSEKESQLHLVDLQALRGYENYIGIIGRLLNSIGIEPTDETEVMMGVRAAGLTPGDYTSKFKLALDQNMTAYEAMQKIYLTLAQMMQQNKPGIIADIDIEFLHDYRVAIRRTRAGLNQVRGVLPPSWESRFKQEFARLGKMCNRLRDLDVYLLEEKNYRALLPDPLKPGLHPLFSGLKRERNRERKKIAAALQQTESDETIYAWQMMLEKPLVSDEGQPNANRSVFELANELILIQYDKVLKYGNKIVADSPDEKLHKLRLHCKKLRYLLEFFMALYPEEKITCLIKQLKQLQDNLGTFNDLYVQQNQLFESLQYLKIQNKEAREEAAAIGGLLSVLNQKQNEIRKAFKKTFNVFSSEANQAQFHELFDNH